MSIQDFLTFLKAMIEELAPAFAVVFWDYSQAQVNAAKAETARVQEQLQVEKNHEAIDAKYAGKSDNDILDDAIKGGGTGQPGSGDTTH